LLRRYALREFPGDLEETYRSYGHDSYSPPNPPQTTDIAEATAEAIHAREELANAVQGFQTQMRHDAPDLDSDLPDPLRQSLFAIRGHLAHAVPFREAEEKLRLAVERAGSKANGLEALAAWTGGAALEGKSAMEAHSLADTLNRADREIEQTRSLERAALAALPPDAAGPEAQFPALKKNVIVRVKGAGSSADGRIARCKQEIWILSGREVRRTISLIEIETGSGHQMCASREVKIYPVRAGDTLESIFDENAAQ
jgi:hypothetical protein